jgi:hypothetical protein
LNVVVGARCEEHLFRITRHSTDFHCAQEYTAVERFATTPAILDLDRTRDNAPHTAEG